MTKALAIGFFLVSLVGCGKSDNNNGTLNALSNSNVVQMTNANQFSPNHLEIKAGESVTWMNVSGETHTVTGPDFDSGDVTTGGGYTHTFNTAGTVAYHCRLHPNMVGEIVVSP